MEFGVVFHLGGRASRADFVAGIGPALEERGFNSIWIAEHALAFDNPKSRYPYTEDGVPPFSSPAVNFLEPFTALSFIAATTTTLRLATGICLIPQRNPVYTAKHVADLDVLSGGRFDFGIGIGWLKEEFDALGVSWERRGARTNEYIEIAKTLWSEGPSQFAGEFYTLPECHLYPKPIQHPHPPIYSGGESLAALRRVAKHCDGWFGVDRPDEVQAGVDKLKPLLAEYGRTMDEIKIHAAPLQDVTLDTVKQYRDAGADQINLVASRDTLADLSDTLDDVKRELDRWANELVVPGKSL